MATPIVPITWSSSPTWGSPATTVTSDSLSIVDTYITPSISLSSSGGSMEGSLALVAQPGSVTLQTISVFTFTTGLTKTIVFNTFNVVAYTSVAIVWTETAGNDHGTLNNNVVGNGWNSSNGPLILWSAASPSADPPAASSDSYTLSGATYISPSITANGRAGSGIVSGTVTVVAQPGSVQLAGVSIAAGDLAVDTVGLGTISVAGYTSVALAYTASGSAGVLANASAAAGWNPATVPLCTWIGNQQSATPPTIDGDDFYWPSNATTIQPQVTAYGTSSTGLGGTLNLNVYNSHAGHSSVVGSLTVTEAASASGVYQFTAYTILSGDTYAFLSWAQTSNFGYFDNLTSGDGWNPALAVDAGYFSGGTWITTVPPTPILPVVVLPKAYATLITSMGNGYGVDVLCLTDIDPNLSVTQNALPQDIFHLITESPGTIFWAPNASFSIRSLLSQGFTQASILSVQAILQAIISADQRVAQCQVSVVFDGEETLMVTIQVTPQQGVSFDLVVAIGKVTISLISVGVGS